MENETREDYQENILRLGDNHDVDLVKEVVFGKLLLDPVDLQETIYRRYRKEDC